MVPVAQAIVGFTTALITLLECVLALGIERTKHEKLSENPK
jgi:hypothetical protein